MNTNTRQKINNNIMNAIEFELTEYKTAEQFADDVQSLADDNWGGELPDDVDRDDLIAFWNEETAGQRALEALKTDSSDMRLAHVESYSPDCPICGMSAQDDDDLDDEAVYPCGHFVGQYNQWHDEDNYQYELAGVSTHRVMVKYQVGGICEYFFATTDTDDVMSASEVTQRFGLTDSTVRQAINRGLKARKSGGTWLIKRSVAEARWGKPKS